MAITHTSLAGDSSAYAGRQAFEKPEAIVLWRKIRNFLQFFRKRREHQDLLDLPDYLLDDIGLSRADVLAARLGPSSESRKTGR